MEGTSGFAHHVSTPTRADQPEYKSLSCGEPVAMRLVPLDRTMELPLTLAGGLRTTFADVVWSPLPGRLAALMRRLHADRNEHSGEERDNGGSATKKSSHFDP